MGLIVDLFAGGGGASTGLEMALGRSPDIAINHDHEALAMHAANHPRTRHWCANVLKVLPLETTGGAAVDWLHASPDCTHFSKAKGGKPRSQFIRDLAWVVIRWAEDTRPTVISLENVEEFQTWGPVNRCGQPIREQSGATFRSWVRRLRRLGYKVSWRELRACDFGAPTTRKRLFVVARRDGKPVSWPKPSHGDPASAAVQSGKLLPWRTAAQCIDWSLPTQSIFTRKKPLADNTLRRIAEGIRRYVLHAAEPFLVSYYGAKSANDFRGSSLDHPLRTQTTENRFALVSPCIVKPNHTTKDGSYKPFRGQATDAPLGVITQAPGFALMSASMVKLRGTNIGSPADAPLHTVSAQGQHHAMISAHMTKYYGKSEGASLTDPLHTLSSKEHMGLVSACMVKYYGTALAAPVDEPAHTLTSKARMGLVCASLGDADHYAQVRAFLRSFGVIGPDAEAEVSIKGETYRITDIALRMLKPRELYRAQGFADSYVIAPQHKGKPLTITAQVRMCGNSVPPQFVAALVRANGPATWAAPRPPRKLALFEYAYAQNSSCKEARI